MDVLKSGKESADRANYRVETATEILTGMANEHYVSKDMARGTELEGPARVSYEFAADCDVDQVGFVQHDSIDLFGASPDGLIGSDGGLELKAPRPTTHVKWALAGEVPEDHKWQCFAGMDCCEREWWDFASYCPNMPKHMQIFRKRLYRDEVAIVKMRAGILQFLEEVQWTIERMELLFGKAPAVKQEPTLQSEYGITNADIAWIQEQQRI